MATRKTSRLLGGVETGGSKFVCALGTPRGEILEEHSIPTTTPDETLGAVRAFFAEQRERGHAVEAIGVASFGPLELNRTATFYGHLTTTPKAGWAHVDLLGELARMEVPIALDTDVNGALLGESVWGAGRDLANLAYVTVGTGIGVGAMCQGRLLGGASHPEMGHMLVPIDADEIDAFEGTCPYHGRCLEGLASGHAIHTRWGQALSELPPDHPAWQLEARYLAAAVVNLTAVLQPDRIIFGGGAMQADLLPLIRQRAFDLMNGYHQRLAGPRRMEAYLCAPQLAPRSGVLGAIALAERALQ